MEDPKEGTAKGESSASQSVKNNTATVQLQSNDAIDSTDVCSSHVKRRKVSASTHAKIKVKDFIAKAAGQQDIESKRHILETGIKENPGSALLWKERVEIENDREVKKKLLHSAIKHCGKQIDLLLAYANLESYDNAKKILTKMTKKYPSKRQIWLALAKLEETNKNFHLIQDIVERALLSIACNGVDILKSEWIQEAIEAEKSGSIICSREIIKSVIGLNNDSGSRKMVWMKDVVECNKKGAHESVRTIYGHVIQAYPTKISIWICAIFMEKAFESPEHLKNILQLTQKDDIINLLINAKIKWMAGDFDSAQLYFVLAFHVNPECKEVLLEPLLQFMHDHREKLDYELKFMDRFEKAGEEKELNPSMVLKFIKLVCSYNTAFVHVDILEAAKHFKTAPELWMAKGQIETQANQLDKAADTYESGLQYNPYFIQLWLLRSDLEKNHGKIVKARSILECARVENPKNDQLWIAAIRLEMYACEKKMAAFLLSKALQQCPKSSELISEDILMTELHAQKFKMDNALKMFKEDPHVCLTASKLFWIQKDIPRCREWLNKTVKTNPEFGDAWGYLYKFEMLHGTKDQQDAVLLRCKSAMPKQGREWCKISKNITNLHLTIEEMLLRVVESLPTPQ